MKQSVPTPCSPKIRPPRRLKPCLMDNSPKKLEATDKHYQETVHSCADHKDRRSSKSCATAGLCRAQSSKNRIISSIHLSQPTGNVSLTRPLDECAIQWNSRIWPKNCEQNANLMGMQLFIFRNIPCVTGQSIAFWRPLLIWIVSSSVR